MRHYVLTRSAYGPGWTLEANRRRLDITRAVTARLMARQTCRDWTWIVLLDPRDPLREERCDVFADAAPHLQVIWWEHDGTHSGVAFDAYRAPWAEAIGPRDDVILQTRLDDDDGLAPHSLAWYQQGARWLKGHRRVILMLPRGVWVWRGRYALRSHRKNAMHTLVTRPGERLGVYDYGHVKAREHARVIPLGTQLGWLWVRHQDTLSPLYRRQDKPITDRVRRWFPVDWDALERAWA